MKLELEIRGTGQDLVLLHGWGMNRAVWSDLVPYLSNNFRMHLVDLPGHGNSAFDDRYDIDAWALAVLDVVPQNASWVGWSLGGLVALRALQLQPARINKLLLLASTPRFVTAQDWPDAVDDDVLVTFSNQLEQDFDTTLQRFLALQVMGSKQSAQTLHRLRTRLMGQSMPDTSALQAGLSILRTSDLRAVLEDCPVPLYWLLGQRDTIIPSAVAAGFPAIPSQVIAGAGHAPFISHPETCAVYLTEWLCEAESQVRHGR